MNLKKNSKKLKSKEKPSRPVNPLRNRLLLKMEKRNQLLPQLFINQMELKLKKDWKRLMMEKVILKERNLSMGNQLNSSKID